MYWQSKPEVLSSAIAMGTFSLGLEDVNLYDLVKYNEVSYDILNLINCLLFPALKMRVSVFSTG